MENNPGKKDPPSDSSTIDIHTPYQSEDSNCSEDWYDAAYNHESYYESSESYDDLANEPTVYELYERMSAVSSPNNDNAPEVIDDIDTMEENNNDPNNNMDSIEVVDNANSPIVKPEVCEDVDFIDLTNNPKPGCSKDSTSVSQPGCSRDFAGVLQPGCSKNEPQTSQPGCSKDSEPISELDVTDSRCDKSVQEYTEITNACVSATYNTDSPGEFPSYFVSSVIGKVPSGNSIKMEEKAVVIDLSEIDNQKMNANIVKRRSMEDICTVRNKKTSPDSNIPRLPKSQMQTPTIKKSHIPVRSSKSTKSETASHSETPEQRETILHPENDGEEKLKQIAAVVDSKTGTVPKVSAQVQKQPQFQGRRKSINSQTGDTMKLLDEGLSTPAVDPIVLNNNADAVRQVRKSIKKRKQKNQGITLLQNSNIPAILNEALMKQVAVPSNSIPTKGTVPKERARIQNSQHPQQRETIPIVNEMLQQSTKGSHGQGSGSSNATKMAMSSTNEGKIGGHEQSTNRQFCMEMYNELQDIFPNVHPDYLKKMCPPNWGPGDRAAHLTPIISNILENKDNLPPAPAKVQSKNSDRARATDIAFINVNDLYDNLLSIFPNADPQYLLRFAEENIFNPSEVKIFIESKLEKPDYPTREQYLARQKSLEQQKRYTTGFDVKQYIAIIPDPFKQFTDPNRKCQYDAGAIDFLKFFFKRHELAVISQQYSACAFNLTATVEQLEHSPGQLMSTRRITRRRTENLLLLQEIAFIEHRKEIKKHMEMVKRAEEMEIQSLKEENGLVTCECCYDSECALTRCTFCDNGHLFCNNCVLTGAKTKISDGETRLYCFLECGSEFSLVDLQRILPPTTFSAFMKARQAAEIKEAHLEGLVSCPFCSFCSIPPKEEKIFKCLNPECGKESCQLCKQLSHVPLKCNEVINADQARRYIEERMTQALARHCYKCKRGYVKEGGCNKIQCPCGAMMCYLCDKPIKDYKHFRDRYANNNDPNLCPLDSDDRTINTLAIRQVAGQAQEEIKKYNPNIIVDTTKLLPALPRGQTGPLNPDQVPRRALQAINIHDL